MRFISFLLVLALSACENKAQVWGVGSTTQSDTSSDTASDDTDSVDSDDSAADDTGDTDADADTDTDSDTDADSDADSDTDTDSDADADSDTDADTDSDADTDMGTELVDNDSDGYTPDTDCDDYDDLVNPGASESCNGMDDDCDGLVDEDVAGAPTWYADNDGDGYGNAADSTTACSQPDGYVADNTDCRDTSRSVHPGATEYTNSVDDDCDGLVDETVDVEPEPEDSGIEDTGDTAEPEDTDTPEVIDADGDGYPAGEDCDDTDPEVNVRTDYWWDNDSDGFGGEYAGSGCGVVGSLVVVNNDDCDDSDTSIYWGASEICGDGIDQDCDGADEVCPEPEPVDSDGDGYPVGEDCDDTDPGVNVRTDYWWDNDSDGFGGEYAGSGCGVVGSLVVNNDDDCDDSDTSIYWGASEICGDGIDQDCDGADEVCPEPEPVDSDGDGYPVGEDCDDSDADIYPGAPEYCNGVDDDCDIVVDEVGAVDAETWYVDNDGDGYGYEDITTLPFPGMCDQPVGYVSDDDDCDDYDDLVNPGATEIVGDSIDNDCDGLIDETVDVEPEPEPEDTGLPTETDADGDGYTMDEDCDDTDAEVNPEAEEVAGDLVDNDCDGIVDNGLAVTVSSTVFASSWTFCYESSGDWSHWWGGSIGCETISAGTSSVFVDGFPTGASYIRLNGERSGGWLVEYGPIWWITSIAFDGEELTIGLDSSYNCYPVDNHMGGNNLYCVLE